MIRNTLFLVTLGLSLILTASAQTVDVSLDYIVPAEWNRTTEPNIKITSPDGLTTILMGLSAGRITAVEEVARRGDTLMRSLHSKKLITQEVFSIADQAGWRMELQGKMSRTSEMYRYTIICVKREEAFATIIVAAPLSTYDKYREGIDKVINSVRVVIGDSDTVTNEVQQPSALTEYSSVALGMKITLQPGWKLKSEAPGQFSGTPKSTFVPEAGTAMVSLSVDENSLPHKDHVAEVLLNIWKRSKSVEKLGQSPVTIAGLPGTKLDLMTETPEGVTIRRVVCIISHHGRHYLAAGGALDSEYEQFAEVMQRMMESVQLIGR